MGNDSIKYSKCKRVIYDHNLRYVNEKERKEKNIKSKGIGIWICTKCDAIVHSM